MKKYLIIPICVLGLVAAGLLSGCNTVRGVGKDVSSAGTEIQRAA